MWEREEKQEERGREKNGSLHWRGIEPRSPAWQARILPLNHQCLAESKAHYFITYSCLLLLNFTKIDIIVKNCLKSIKLIPIYRGNSTAKFPRDKD